MKGLSFLKVAIKQLEGEIENDRAVIESIIDDPTMVAIDANMPSSADKVAYVIHERLHHLGVHLHALAEAYRILNEKTVDDGAKD